MAQSKLSCPDCGTVLRPAKPVAPGKKVKCPRCETIFVAGSEEDEVEERPRKKAEKAAPAKKKEEKPAKKKTAEDEEGGVYSTLTEPEDHDPKKKVKIDWEGKVKQKDPRGPAIVALTPPATKLQLVGFAGLAGWLVLIFLLVIPALFPVREDKPKEDDFRPQAAEKDKKKPAKPLINYKIFDLTILDDMIKLPWYIFLAAMIPLFLLGCYSFCVLVGGIKMQNLESRAWGIAGAVLAILPIHVVGLVCTLALIIGGIWGMLDDDLSFPQQVSLGVGALTWLISAGVGGWCIKTLMDEKVIEGFEYEPE